jgi:2-polyprenyl-6-methoxyphenol hydroxylase-like FAD-dependent oxidoreductase
MGESIGTAVEDGALIAHVLTRHKERTVTQLFQDYETLRRAEINHLYAETTMRWKSVMKKDLGWLGSIILEWTTLAVLTWMSWTQKNKFGKDVAKLELPA